MQLTTTNRGFAPATLSEAIAFSDMLASSPTLGGSWISSLSAAMG